MLHDYFILWSDYEPVQVSYHTFSSLQCTALCKKLQIFKPFDPKLLSQFSLVWCALCLFDKGMKRWAYYLEAGTAQLSLSNISRHSTPSLSLSYESLASCLLHISNIWLVLNPIASEKQLLICFHADLCSTSCGQIIFSGLQQVERCNLKPNVGGTFLKVGAQARAYARGFGVNPLPWAW